MPQRLWIWILMCYTPMTFFWVPVLLFLAAGFHGLRLFPSFVEGSWSAQTSSTTLFEQPIFDRQISICGTCSSYSGGNGRHIASESSAREAGSLKAAQRILLWSSSNRDNSVKQSSGLENENESYTWQQMVYFLVRIIGEQGTSIILCFSIFSQLWLHPVSSDINFYSQFGTGYTLVRKANICITIGG